MGNDDFGLDGRVVVITGGGSGIGRGCALAFAAAGAKVAVLDVNGPSAEETAQAILDSGGQSVPLACDVANPIEVSGAGDQLVKTLGPCDILVNNAASSLPGLLADLSFDDWNRGLLVNLTGYFNCSQIFGRQMREIARGSIVHVASIAGEYPTKSGGAYSVAKAGVRMLSKQLAVEWGEFGIRSNCVSPGFILTNMSEALYRREGLRQAREAMVPAHRIGTPGDVARAVMFLASDCSSYVTGEEIAVDGGLTRSFLRLAQRTI